MKRVRIALMAAALTLAAGVLLIAWLGLRSDANDEGAVPAIAADITNRIERGAYLARAGNCRGCHTERGGAGYAGGRAIATSFGEFRAPNITPDGETGIGRWSETDFWRALHEGRRPDGTLLYPAFPYTHFTKIARADVAALFAYLQSVPAVNKPNLAHNLQFPYDQRWLLVAWRALFFRPGVYQADARHDERWNRGAYLVQGLGHCGACHDARNALGAARVQDNAAGGAVLNWYAPALDSSAEAGVAAWSEDEVAALLNAGINGKASTLGPMAEVVYNSLQHLREDDVRAMAAYLRALPDRAPKESAAVRQSEEARVVANARGARGYAEHCAGCHGKNGEGRLPAARALAGNRAVTLHSNVNAVRIVLQGGYAPGTAGNPQPYGMPPFGGTLSDEQIADILSYIRAAWGNDAPAVLSYEVTRQRGSVLW
jgi:mono/diheme cytochrome c family protein